MKSSHWRRCVTVLALFASGLGGCGDVDGGTPIVADLVGSTLSGWRSSLERDDTGAFIVEGDIPIHTEMELEAYFYSRVSSGSALTINQSGGEDDRWSLRNQYNLTYCINNNFGGQKAQVVTAMANATGAWEDAAELRFVYLSGEDSTCTASNTDVVFDVRSGSCGAGCSARAFFPSYSRSSRNIIIASSAFTDPDHSLTGILTHELGHALGFRHEHIWQGCTSESTTDAEQLTGYDSASVMHYTWCPTSPGPDDYALTDRDALGAACVYTRTVPRSACDGDRTAEESIWWSDGPSRTWSGQTIGVSGFYQTFSGDFDGDGGDDIFWYGRGSRPDFIWWSNGDGTFTGQSKTVNGLYDPFVGDFDGDGRDDVFWYGATNRPDFIWWGNADRTFTGQAKAVSGVYWPLAGDFDGDGGDDIVWYGPGSAVDYVWWSDLDRTFTGSSTTVNGTYEPFTGDFDGDGRGDVFWYGPGTGSDFVWWGNASRTFTSQAKTVSGAYQPIAGNFDGLFGDDIFWYRSGTSVDFLWWSDGDRTFTGGNINVYGDYAPICGDFDADGYHDIVWYGPLSTP